MDPPYLAQALNKIHPVKRIPGSTQLRALGAWGGVLAIGTLYMIQPWDYLKSLVNPPGENTNH